MPAGAPLAPLLAQAAALISEGHRLESNAANLSVTLRPLLRSMNSYYTNKIEGQHMVVLGLGDSYGTVQSRVPSAAQRKGQDSVGKLLGPLQRDIVTRACDDFTLGFG
jgi:hypothetical protein